jgi:dihydrofolate reductase
MTIKCSVFIATSLDGYIARKNGDIDWLPNLDDGSKGEDFGYKEFFTSVDTLVMGRKTYELVLTFKDWPYSGKKVIVLSSKYPKLPATLAGDVEMMACPPAQVVDRLSKTGSQHIYVDGGNTIQGFLKAGLIQEMTITRIPVLIGDGIPLFGKLDQDMKFQHIETKMYRNGLVQSRYRVENAV